MVQTRFSLFLGLASALSFVFVTLGAADIITIVAPAGLEDREGNGFIPPGNTIFRGQELYVAEDFHSLPDGGAWIVAGAERADSRQGNPGTMRATQLTITLGTTEKDNLGRVFAENLGVDRLTVIDGPIEIHYEVTDQKPNPFSASYEFDKPFHYDPANGNLVVDWISPSSWTGGSVSLDNQSVPRISQVYGGPAAERGSDTFRYSLPWQFTFVPVGDINYDGTLDSEDIDALSPAPFDLDGDNAIDENDRTFWVHNIMSTWFGDSNLDGEFNSGDFIDVFQAGKFELDTEAKWGDGDWNGDGRFNSSDLIRAFQDGGFERGPRIVAQVVPEPSGLLLVFTSIIALIRWRHSEVHRIGR